MAKKCPICGTAGHACGPTPPVAPVHALEEAPAVSDRGPRRRYPHPSGRPGAYIVTDAAHAARLGLAGGHPAPIYRTGASSTFWARTTALAARLELLGVTAEVAAAIRLELDGGSDLLELERLEALPDGELLLEADARRRRLVEAAVAHVEAAAAPPPPAPPAEKAARTAPPNTGRRRPRTRPADA